MTNSLSRRGWTVKLTPSPRLTMKPEPRPDYTEIHAAERTIVTGPFRQFPRSILHGEWAPAPTPPWFLDNRSATSTVQKLTAFAARPRWRALPAIIVSALRG